MAGKAQPMLGRFWGRVDQRGDDECWPWLGGRTVKGYGVFFPIKSRAEGAHRVAWELATTNPIPPGMQVMHSCDNPPCCNPRHLSVGSSSDNHWDASRKGRIPGNRTPRGGHPPKFSPEVVRALRDEGRTFREIGELLHISPATALRTLRRG